tara:strand:+ start:154 stop:690 length:537 start_codon:yes stop_codon:yes gene_type:complete
MDGEGWMHFVHKVPMKAQHGDGVMTITAADVEKAQHAWGDGIVEIAAAFDAGMDHAQRAKVHVETLYAYDLGPVLFKPTFAIKQQFRPTFEGALSYFIGGNKAFSEDRGFAIQSWTNVRFENQKMALSGTTAMAMGNYFFTPPKGEEVKVEFSFGYVVDSTGALRIQLHHSSVPGSIN